MSKTNYLGNENLAEKMKKIKQEMHSQPISKSNTTTETEKTQKIKENESQPLRVKNSNKISPKLFVSGRLDRKNCSYVAKSLFVLESLDKEIKKYCRGGDAAILNFLLKEGLEKIKTFDSTISIDVSDIENDIT